jgi:hypothetical protein
MLTLWDTTPVGGIVWQVISLHQHNAVEGFA